MYFFQNILVGIDITIEGDLTPGSQVALDQALDMAKTSAVKISVVHVIEGSSQAGEIMSLQPQSLVRRRMEKVEGLYSRLKADLGDLASQVSFSTCFGTHWQKLILKVEEGHHDLVMVGTQGRGIAGRTLFGSVGNRLLRYCRCPVWAVKPQDHTDIRSVLVAHDLTPVGSNCLRIAGNLADNSHAQLKILHVLELPEEKSFLGTISEQELEKRKLQAYEQIAEQCKALTIQSLVEIHIVNGSAHAEIISFLEHNQIDLLCMGTVGRSGLAGIITGNTAENVLPWVRCSLLTIKPDEFVNPVAAAAAETETLESNKRSA